MNSRTLYFHCAKSGHKFDAIRTCEKASFCVIDQDMVVPEKYTTCFRSVIVFGRAAIVEDEAEMRSAIEKLAVSPRTNFVYNLRAALAALFLLRQI